MEKAKRNSFKYQFLTLLKRSLSFFFWSLEEFFHGASTSCQTIKKVKVCLLFEGSIDADRNREVSFRRNRSMVLYLPAKNL